MDRDNSFISQKGNYRQLLTFKKAECIYDLTYHFAHRFLSGKDRTIDQMIQAARSGKQNIAEGSAASSTSRETEIKLTNVAKAGMQELLIDYEDYLRVRKLKLWETSDSSFEQTRRYCSTHNSASDYTDRIEERTDEVIANIAIILIHQLDYSLFRRIEAQKKQFLEQGGIREEMSKVRRKQRGF